MKAWDADPEVIDLWVRYLRRHALGGVGVRVVRWERVSIGEGKKRDAEVKRMLHKNIEEDMKNEEGGGGAGWGRRKGIKALAQKIISTETQTLHVQSVEETQQHAP